MRIGGIGNSIRPFMLRVGPRLRPTTGSSHILSIVPFPEDTLRVNPVAKSESVDIDHAQPQTYSPQSVFKKRPK